MPEFRDNGAIGQYAEAGESNDPPTAHVGNLSYETVQSDIEQLFDGLRIAQIRLVHDKVTNEFKGYGYVEFADVDNLNSALERNGADFMGRNVRVSVAQSKRRTPGAGGERSGFSRDRDRGGDKRREYKERDNDTSYKRPIPDAPPYTAYIGNLARTTDEAELHLLLDGLAVSEVRVARDKLTGESRGHAFVDFSDRESLQESLKLQNYNFNGQILTANVARTHSNTNEPRNRDNFHQGQQRDFTRHGQGREAPSAFGGQRRDVHGPGNGEPRVVNKPEEFKELSEEEERQRKKLVLKPRSAAAVVGKIPDRAPVTKQKEDPFGGAKPRDEVAYQKKMKELEARIQAKKDSSNKPAETTAPKSAVAEAGSRQKAEQGNTQARGQGPSTRGRPSAPAATAERSGAWQQQKSR